LSGKCQLQGDNVFYVRSSTDLFSLLYLTEQKKDISHYFTVVKQQAKVRATPFLRLDRFFISDGNIESFIEPKGMLQVKSLGGLSNKIA